MKLWIRGTSITSFGELWKKSLRELLLAAATDAIADAGLEPSAIQAVFVGNMAAEAFSGQAHLGALVSSFWPHHPPAMRIEGACASGSLALLAAEAALQAGLYEHVLVLGGEKMTDVSAPEATRILAGAADVEREYGTTFPGLYALLAQAHMKQYGTTREQLATVAVKNHRHALDNPDAQFHKAITTEQVLSSPLVADPLRLLDCSPVSDGAAAVILSRTSENAKAQILGAGHASDALTLSDRASLTSLGATKRAGAQAFKQAKLHITDIPVFELHDCFTIAELLALEDLRVFPVGEAAAATAAGKTTYGGQVVVNPSGGLKGSGHPVGATGVKQVAYLTRLLAAKKFARALTQNVGGSGATAVVHILEAV